MQPLSAPKWCAALARAREKSSAAGGEIDAGAAEMEGDGGGADQNLTRARPHAGLDRVGTALAIVERVGGAAALRDGCGGEGGARFSEGFILSGGKGGGAAASRWGCTDDTTLPPGLSVFYSAASAG